MVKRELVPILGLAVAAIIAYKYKTQLLNLVPSEAITKSDELIIARKISGLLKYQK